jgi:hypothetical protein
MEEEKYHNKCRILTSNSYRVINSLLDRHLNKNGDLLIQLYMRRKDIACLSMTKLQYVS